MPDQSIRLQGSQPHAVNGDSMGVIEVSTVALLAVASLGAGAAQAQGKGNRGADKTVSLSATLTELNGSGASGTATAEVRNQKIQHIEVHASGLTPDAPHAQHIHYGEQANARHWHSTATVTDD